MLPDKTPPRHLRYGNSALPSGNPWFTVKYILTVTLQDVGHSDEARELLVGLLVGNLKTSVCPHRNLASPVCDNH